MTWYELNPSRLVIEYVRVSHRYPGFVLNRSKRFKLYWTGALNIAVGTINPERLVLRIEYPDSFPALGPDVTITSPEIPSEEVGHKWHRWPIDGSICYVKPRDWAINVTTDEIITKVEDWYFNYVAVKNGLVLEMPDIGRVKLTM